MMDRGRVHSGKGSPHAALRRAVRLVFGLGMMSAAMGVAAQQCPGGYCRPITVYGGPIS
jgi:hypothetical protein